MQHSKKNSFDLYFHSSDKPIRIKRHKRLRIKTKQKRKKCKTEVRNEKKKMNKQIDRSVVNPNSSKEFFSDKIVNRKFSFSVQLYFLTTNKTE